MLGFKAVNIVLPRGKFFLYEILLFTDYVGYFYCRYGGNMVEKGSCIEKIASLYLNVSQQCNIVLVPNPFYVIMYTEKRRSVVSCKLPQQCC